MSRGTISSKFSALLSAGFVAISLAAASTAVWADYEVQATVSTKAGSTADNANSGILVNTSGIAESASSIAIDPATSATLASSTAQASSAPGALRAAVRSDSFTSSVGGATANATAAFWDNLSFSSATLSSSDTVDLAFGWTVTGALDGCAICPAQGSVSSALTVASAGSFLNGVSSVTYGRSFIGGIDSLTSSPILADIVLSTTLSDVVGLRGNLSVFAGVDGINSWAQADFSHTASLFVEVLTPGVDLHSDSGLINYSVAAIAPVPEPETYAMLLAGLGLLGWHVQRRKKSQVH